MVRQSYLLPLFLLFGACSSESEVAPPPVDSVGEGAQADAVMADEIPRELRGTWGMTPGDCDDSRGDAKGRMEVEADRLVFYESTAMLDEISEAEPHRLIAIFEFEGEGQKWSRKIALEVEEDGQSLVRRDLDDQQLTGSLSYNRCTA
ncbi:hypothetical protein [Sphingomicrobium lutaoense]|uniref:Lipoprotein n=1 Tax=Sphingomicrobium lutaoense TaxID=515949 RepID=A0A839YVL5_9SPHN|nr:hypothetical protein [Sphingomicrobium lutaoense]MBB3763249.1 hypothetical protein [Sphingomicrobium lutaoense]